jgi:hypothetical protein
MLSEYRPGYLRKANPMNRRVWTAACTLAMFVAPVTLLGQDKPDFSGEWKLNAAKSDFGMGQAPEKLIFKIDHKDPDFKITQTVAGPQGEMTNDQTMVIDGKEQTRTSQRGEVRFTPTWVGRQIIADQKLKIQDNDITIKESWSMADDKKSLTVTRQIQSPMGDMTMKIVMDKV